MDFAQKQPIYDQLKAHMLAKPFSELDFPFGEDVHVFRVKRKMFALIGWRNDTLMINVKCDPDEGAALRDIFSCITEGYHMDKRTWLSIYHDEQVPMGEILRLIDNSYKLIVSKMTKKEQLAVNALLID